MKPLIKLSHLFLLSTAVAQVAIYPDEYVAVPEGPFNSPNLPLALGTSRVQCLYEDVDLDIPVGNSITSLGFREDGASNLQTGVSLQLEIRMGWTTSDHQSMSTLFDQNYAAPPVTVFGPAIYTLPNLHDASAPLNNGQFFIPLTTPFAYTPNGRNLLVEYRVIGTSGGGAPFNYRLDRADYYSPITYGPAGCMHSGGGVPDMTLRRTRPGLQWRTDVANAPANAPAFCIINIGSPLAAPYPIAPIFNGVAASCLGQMPLDANTAILSGQSAASGSATWSFTIPNDNAFADMHISSQALFLDFFSPGQVVISNGAEILTGVRNRTAIVSASGSPAVAISGSKSLYYCPVAFFGYQ